MRAWGRRLACKILFLTGFIADASKSEVYGRPVGIAVLPDGALLVADDASNIIWKIQVYSLAR